MKQVVLPERVRQPARNTSTREGSRPPSPLPFEPTSLTSPFNPPSPLPLIKPTHLPFEPASIPAYPSKPRVILEEIYMRQHLDDLC